MARGWRLAALSAAVCAVLLLLTPHHPSRERAEAPAAAGVRGLPPLFAGVLETLRPDTFRLPPTSEITIEAAKAAPGLGAPVLHSEAMAAPATVRAVAAPVAVAKLDGSLERETGEVTGSLPPLADVATPSRLLDLPPVGVADSVPLAGPEDTTDLITRGAPGDPGTFPPLMVVDRLFFTVDPVALPQSPLDYVATGTELMPRSSRKGTRG